MHTQIPAWFFFINWQIVVFEASHELKQTTENVKFLLKAEQKFSAENLYKIPVKNVVIDINFCSKELLESRFVLFLTEVTVEL